MYYRRFVIASRRFLARVLPARDTIGGATSEWDPQGTQPKTGR